MFFSEVFGIQRLPVYWSPWIPLCFRPSLRRRSPLLPYLLPFGSKSLRTFCSCWPGNSKTKTWSHSESLVSDEQSFCPLWFPRERLYIRQGWEILWIPLLVGFYFWIPVFKGLTPAVFHPVICSCPGLPISVIQVKPFAHLIYFCATPFPESGSPCPRLWAPIPFWLCPAVGRQSSTTLAPSSWFPFRTRICGYSVEPHGLSSSNSRSPISFPKGYRRFWSKALRILWFAKFRASSHSAAPSFSKCFGFTCLSIYARAHFQRISQVASPAFGCAFSSTNYSSWSHLSGIELMPAFRTIVCWQYPAERDLFASSTCQACSRRGWWETFSWLCAQHFGLPCAVFRKIAQPWTLWFSFAIGFVKAGDYWFWEAGRSVLSAWILFGWGG